VGQFDIPEILVCVPDQASMPAIGQLLRRDAI